MVKETTGSTVYSQPKGAIKDEKAGSQRHRHDPPPAPSFCPLHGIENITLAVQKRMQEGGNAAVKGEGMKDDPVGLLKMMEGRQEREQKRGRGLQAPPI